MAVVTQCPTDAVEKLLASLRLGCGFDIYGNDQYICAPNEAKTSLVELCIEGIMGIIDKGKPLNYYNMQRGHDRTPAQHNLQQTEITAHLRQRGKTQAEMTTHVVSYVRYRKFRKSKNVLIFSLAMPVQVLPQKAVHLLLLFVLLPLFLYKCRHKIFRSILKCKTKNKELF